MVEPKKGTCRGCGRENCSINADGTVRHHQGTEPEHYAGPDSKKCKGVGQPPEESADLPRTVTGFVCRIPAGPEGCGRPVQLTSNGRARSHLNNAGHPCDGGSDWPLKVDPQGNVSDMKPVGEVRPAATELRYGSDDPVEDFLGTGTGPDDDGAMDQYGRGRDGEIHPDAPGAALAGLMGAEIGDPGTVLGRMTDDRFADAVTRAPYHARLGELTEGVLFRRHTAAPPMDQLVYRAGVPVMGLVSATVVTAGPYAGRTGSLTNLEEEITCTDLDGRPRSRRSTTTQPTSLPENGPQGRTNSPTPSATGPGSKPSTRASAPDAGVKSTPETGSGPTGKAPTSVRTAVTPEEKEAGDLLAGVSGDHGEAKAEYGRWGRYKLRHPDTGKPVEWTRATTFAKSISDTFTLAQWGKRNVIVGATKRPDIIAMAHGKDVRDDKDQLNAWAEELETAAGSKVSANLGTAVHSFTELIDRDWAHRRTVLAEQIPEDFRPHCEAYILMLEETGLEPVPHMIEFSTGVLQYEVMGTSDNCYRATKHLVLKMPRGEVRLSPGEHVIGDKKTGKDLSYGWQEICIQLAVYAQGVNSLGMFDWGTKTWDKDPLSRFAEPGTKVREDAGVIVHIPVDPRSEKEPALYGVDLESGWSAAVLCERVRTWRKLRTLAGPVVVVDEETDPDTGVPTDVLSPTALAPREPTIRERAETVTSRTEASAVYQAAVKAGLPVAEVKALIALMQERIAAVAEPGGAKV